MKVDDEWLMGGCKRLIACPTTCIYLKLETIQYLFVEYCDWVTDLKGIKRKETTFPDIVWYSYSKEAKELKIKS